MTKKELRSELLKKVFKIRPDLKDKNYIMLNTHHFLPNGKFLPYFVIKDNVEDKEWTFLTMRHIHLTADQKINRILVQSYSVGITLDEMLNCERKRRVNNNGS